MELQLRWIGTTPLPIVQSALDALAPDGAAELSAHPGGPREGRIWIEGRLESPVARPAWLAELLAMAVERGDDALLLPAAWRPLRPRLACFDGDMTLVEAETIDILGEIAGRAQEISAVTRRAMAGELDFAAALRERLAQLAGLPESALDEARARIAWTAGAPEVLRALRASGCRTAALSGGFHFLLDPLARQEKIDAVRANRLEVRDGVLTGQLVGALIDAAAKADALRELAREARLQPEQILAVGDGANDAPMLEAAGVGIAFRPKAALLRSACGCVADAQLSRLAALLDLEEG